MTKIARAVSFFFIFQIATVASAFANDISILTGIGFAPSVRALAAEYEAQTGTKINVTVDVVGKVQTRVEAGEKYDLVIATTSVLNELEKETLVAGNHINLAKMVLGMASRTGAPKPNLVDAQALKAVLLEARNVAYVNPELGALSAKFLLQQAENLGILENLKSKTLLQNRAIGVPESVAEGRAEVGVALVSEMLTTPGILVQPFPGDVQLDLVYAAAIGTNANNTNGAKSMLALFLSAHAREIFRNSGLLPVPN